MRVSRRAKPFHASGPLAAMGLDAVGPSWKCTDRGRRPFIACEKVVGKTDAEVHRFPRPALAASLERCCLRVDIRRRGRSHWIHRESAHACSVQQHGRCEARARSSDRRSNEITFAVSVRRSLILRGVPEWDKSFNAASSASCNIASLQTASDRDLRESELRQKRGSACAK